MNPELITAFEDGTLNLKEFDHKKHVYIAYVYLRTMPFLEAFEKYCYHLKMLLDKNGYGGKFSRDITFSYFEKIEAAMQLSSCLDQVVAQLNSK